MGKKWESCHLSNPGRCRLVPLSLATYRRAAKGLILCNPHSFSPLKNTGRASIRDAMALSIKGKIKVSNFNLRPEE